MVVSAAAGFIICVRLIFRVDLCGVLQTAEALLDEADLDLSQRACAAGWRTQAPVHTTPLAREEEEEEQGAKNELQIQVR